MEDNKADSSTKPVKTPDHVLNFEVDGENTKVDLADVASLFDGVNKYNETYSLGNIAFRRIKAVTKMEDRDNSEEEENKQTDVFFLQNINKDLLEKIGLFIEPVSGKKGAVYDSKGVTSQGEIRFNISNQGRFVSFLDALEPEIINDSGIQKGLENLPVIFSKQIADNYDLQAPGNEAIQLFTAMDDIVKNYKRLGMDDAVSRLETYLEHGRKGDLREYVLIDKKALLKKPEDEYFGPGRWQLDSVPEMLEERWSEALYILSATKKNTNALSLYEELKSNLELCVDAAIKQEKEEGPARNNPEMAHDKMLVVLESAKQRLQDL
jgi:hypothetical protein